MYSVKEVAERLRISSTCVYQLVEHGKLACHRIGLGRGAIRISDDDLASYLASCRQETQLPREPVRSRTDKPTKFKHLQLEKEVRTP